MSNPAKANVVLVDVLAVYFGRRPSWNGALRTWCVMLVAVHGAMNYLRHLTLGYAPRVNLTTIKIFVLFALALALAFQQARKLYKPAYRLL